uniref:Uncharacterized protein n=1 Tax=Pristionchus pacificus TaxID=54126 RepID=A0A2A6BX45_PRIPA|eukprot:PDM70427.1 hypothetical protein PRIPAC_46673 [Pristionchus pacificus]
MKMFPNSKQFLLASFCKIGYSEFRVLEKEGTQEAMKEEDDASLVEGWKTNLAILQSYDSGTRWKGQLLDYITLRFNAFREEDNARRVT